MTRCYNTCSPPQVDTTMVLREVSRNNTKYHSQIIVYYHLVLLLGHWNCITLTKKLIKK